MPVTTFPAIGTRSYYGASPSINLYQSDLGTSEYGSYKNRWRSDTVLMQGRSYLTTYYDPADDVNRSVYSGPVFSTLFFGTDFSAISGKVIDLIEFYVHRKNDGPASVIPVNVYPSDLTSIPASGASSPAADVNGGPTVLGNVNRDTGVWLPLPAWMLTWVLDEKCLCIYSGNANYATYYGVENASYKPKIRVTWHEPIPQPTAPTIVTIGTVTADEKTFDWSNSSDSAGYFTSADLMYEMQISYNNGTTWGNGVTQDNNARITTATGVSQHLIDLRAALDLEDKQYYYNTQCKIRVRAKTPNYGGVPYYSAWTTSPAFTVNYKITPSAPLSLTPSKVDPFEGEGITFTVGRPDPPGYNTHDHTGAVMGMTYAVELANGTALASGSANVSNTSKEVGYTVGALTAGDDLVTTIRAKCTDAEGQVSPYLTDIAFTIMRFRAPIVIVAGIARAETSASVKIRVLDTGFGAGQNYAQVRKIQFNRGLGWFDAVLGTWDGLDNVFEITGLSPTAHYDLLVRAVNVGPAGLPDKTTDEDKWADADILEYTPSFFAWRDDDATGDQAPAGAFAQAMVIGDDPDVAVNKGCLAVQNGMTLGGKPVLSDAAPKLVNRQDNTTNNVVSDQLIQMGWGYILGNGSSTTALTEDVTFPIAFDNAPIVLISALSARNNSDPAAITDLNSGGNTVAAANGISSSGFTVRIMSAMGYTMASTMRFGYSWIAIGRKARS